MLTFPQNLTVPQKQAFEKRYRQAAAEYIPRRVAYFQAFTGGSYSRITIRGQHTRWGSCSSRGTLSTLEKLLLGQWDGEAFCTVAPGARFSLLDTLMGGGIHQ